MQVGENQQDASIFDATNTDNNAPTIQNMTAKYEPSFAYMHDIFEVNEIGINKFIDMIEQLTDEYDEIGVICCTATIEETNTNTCKIIFTITYDGVAEWTYKFSDIEMNYTQDNKKSIVCHLQLNLITHNILHFMNYCIENNVQFNKKHFVIIHCKHNTYCVFFDRLYELGYGMFGCVYKAYSKTHTFAVKIIIPRNTNDRQSAIREMCVLNTVRLMEDVLKIHDVLVTGSNTMLTCHPINIDQIKSVIMHVSNFSLDIENEPICMFDMAQQPQHIACFLVLDYLRGSTLLKYVSTNEMNNSTNRYNIYQQTKQNRMFVLNKMINVFNMLKNVLHTNNIIHGDIKPDNIMIYGSIHNNAKIVYENLKLIDYGFSSKTLYEIEQAQKYFSLKGTLHYVYPLLTYYHYVDDIQTKKAILKMHNNSILQFAKYTDLWALLMTICEMHCVNPQHFLMMRYIQTASIKFAAIATKSQLYIYAICKIGYLIMKYLCDDLPNYFDFVDKTYEYNNKDSISKKYSDIEYQVYVYAKEFFIKLKKGTIDDMYSLIYMTITDTKLHNI